MNPVSVQEVEQQRVVSHLVVGLTLEVVTRMVCKLSEPYWGSHEHIKLLDVRLQSGDHLNRCCARSHHRYVLPLPLAFAKVVGPPCSMYQAALERMQPFDSFRELPGVQDSVCADEYIASIFSELVRD